jgi:starvation-inducible DNA-binding protein
VRKIGALTLHSIGDIARRTKIEDDDDDYVAPMEMVRRLLADNRKMAEAQRAAIEVCDKRRDTPTGNLLQEVLDETERRIWFLFELTQAEAEDSEAERARP